MPVLLRISTLSPMDWTKLQEGIRWTTLEERGVQDAAEI